MQHHSSLGTEWLLAFPLMPLGKHLPLLVLVLDLISLSLRLYRRSSLWSIVFLRPAETHPQSHFLKQWRAPFSYIPVEFVVYISFMVRFSISSFRCCGVGIAAVYCERNFFLGNFGILGMTPWLVICEAGACLEDVPSFPPFF